MSIHRIFRPLGLAAVLGLAATGGFVLAQGDNPTQGLAPADGSGSYEVSGVEVDVTGKSADQARYAGWRVAQRKGWQILSRRLGGGGALLSDGTLDGMVSGIVVENEQIGPNRYVARLGVLFSRARAGSILGVAAEATRSPPMLTIPIEISGGAAVGFEQKTAWQDAWLRYRTGNSLIDYIRPTGTGTDPLLLNFGQTERRGRGWWRVVLDQYGATDVLIPTVTLRREWPGGPIIGTFQARHGPDNRLIAQFTLRVDNGDALPVLLDAGVKRLDDAYQAALRNGALMGDAGLAYVAPVATPTPLEQPTDLASPGLDGIAGGTGATAGSVVTVQVDTPNAASVTSTESALQAIPGVQSAVTTSLALGGVSVVRVQLEGEPAGLRTALESRGWTVVGSGTTLRIRRAAPAGANSQVGSADNTTG
ncbi:heavy-metal-associated domain-containing protein [Sphingomonas sp. TREG-RG-20F-R18-01]|uniref:heavy-metal-associated domain-containing protein n=1 Tax=Sphingomonas sp. TREG-RG-20F-R18-01 TaxID=2914982 RepID=UPI001F59DD01|nr:heavy-metal-associated domain-containing protein [Sphingomonas sp. TREG-RG-20F-R18-01]